METAILVGRTVVRRSQGRKVSVTNPVLSDNVRERRVGGHVNGDEMQNESDDGRPAEPGGSPDESAGPPGEPPEAGDQRVRPPEPSGERYEAPGSTDRPYGAPGSTGRPQGSSGERYEAPGSMGWPYGAPGPAGPPPGPSGKPDEAPESADPQHRPPRSTDRPYGEPGPTGYLPPTGIGPPPDAAYAPWMVTDFTYPAAAGPTPAGGADRPGTAGEFGATVSAGPSRRRFWPRRRWTRAAVVLLALALVGGALVLLRDQVGSDATDAGPASSNGQPGSTHPNLLASNRDAFNALLNRRSDAVADGDLEAFLADIDPARTKLIRTQRLLFKNLGVLPVKSFKYVSTSYLPPVPAQAGNPDGAFNPGSAIIEARLQLVDADPRPTTAHYSVKLKLRSGRLLITDISSKGAVRPFSPTPWDSTELTVVRTTHMVVGVAADAKDRAQAIADAAERAYETSRGLWPKQARDEFVIFAAGRRSMFESWYGFADDTPDFSVGRALTVPTCCGTRHQRLGDETSTHVILDLSELSDPIDLEWTLAHELTHAVAQPRAAANWEAPSWASEGYAEYVGIRLLDKRGYYALWASDVREYVADGKFRDRLPTDVGFYGRNADINYALSVRFFEYLAGEYGESTVKNFYFYLNAMDPLDVDAAMRKYFHASQKNVVADWAAWVRNS